MAATLEHDIDTNRMQARRLAVLERLGSIRRRVRTHLLLEGLAWWLCTALALAGVTLLLDRLFRPELSMRVALALTAGAILGFLAWRRILRPALLSLNDLDLAELLERRQRGLGQRLTNVLQLPELLSSDPSASPELVEATVLADAEALERTDLRSLFNAGRRRNAVLALVGASASAIAFCMNNPAVASLWARRWLGGSDVRWPQRTYLTIVGLGDDDRLLVPRNEPVTLQLDAQTAFAETQHGWRLNGRGRPLLVEGEDAPRGQIPTSVSVEYRLADGTRRRGAFSQVSPGRFRYELPPLSEPATISVTGGDDWFGPVAVEPIERPGVEVLDIFARRPGKDDAEFHRVGESQLLFLPTTRLELELMGDQPLESARMVLQGTGPAPELLRVGERRYRAKFDMHEPLTLEFQLVGKRGRLESKPYFLTLGILNDRPPRVQVRSSGVGRRVTPVARIPLAVHIADDFGTAEWAVELEETRIEEGKPKATTHRVQHEQVDPESGQKLPVDIARDLQIALAEYNLSPGNSVKLRATAVDACILGVQSSESRWLPFQVVSAEELFYEILMRQREQRAKFAKALESAKESLETLRTLADRQDGANLTRVHQSVARQVWQTANQLDATLQEMTLNDLGSIATRELLEKNVIQAMRALHETEVTKARTEIDALLASAPIDEARRDSAVEAQTAVVDGMQRILDQMAQWESFVDVVNQLRNIIKTQDHLLDSTEKQQKERVNDVFDE
ncbi:MAG TPA: hypothetical protein VHB77_05335 [Planctomycetaceae bacterium]|nr:hypothetical protein [Planctomycetaceae bacterium]